MAHATISTAKPVAGAAAVAGDGKAQVQVQAQPPAQPDIFESVPVAAFHAHVQKQSVVIDAAYDSFDIEFDVLGELSQQPQYIRRLYVPPQNVWKKNRYMNILPHADTRVRLAVVGNDPASDYINASHINRVLCGCRAAYICTQAPTEASVDDFWRMCWEQNTRLIVMLTKEVEKDGQKADRYWPEPLKAATAAPASAAAAAAAVQQKAAAAAAVAAAASSSGKPALGGKQASSAAPSTGGFYLPNADTAASANGGDKKNATAAGAGGGATAAAAPVVEVVDPNTHSELFGQFLVTMKSKSHVSADAIVRVFTIRNTATNVERDLTHFQYTGWPDHGVPQDFGSFVSMFQAYRALRTTSLAPLPAADAAATAPAAAAAAAGGAGATAGTHVAAGAIPVVTHCSAGVGRTGTFCAIDQILDAISRERCTRDSLQQPPPINVFNVIRSLRDQRPFMVQTKAQYVFISLFVDHCIQRSLLGV